MTTPLSSISGLISGIDTSSLIDAIIAQDRAPADAMEAQETTIQNQQAALAQYQPLLQAVDAAATALEDGTAFGNTVANTTAITGTAPVATAASSSAAVTGDYTLTVSKLAAAAKYSGTTVASATTALGQSGSITINGQVITINATDTLTSIRDKINALNTGSTPLNVSASILSVSPTDNRLLLTSTVTGAAGITMADTTGTTLQSLGLLDNTGAIPTSAVLVKGADAAFTIDGIALTRSTNTVSDAIAGVTLTLTSADPTASTDLSVTRDETTASDAMQVFVSAYNALVAFLKQQGTVTSNTTDPTDSTTSTTTVPALYGDSLIRSVRSLLPSALLQPVLGASSTLPTAASAGVSLAEDGTLTFDDTAFADAFNNHFNDLQTVFGETRTADNANVNFTSSGSASASGTWDVNITAAATLASVSTSGFSGTYDAGATPDALTVTDTVTGKNATVNLTTGMTTSDIVTALQSAIAANGLGITVAAVGNDIQMTQQSYGSHSGITLAVTGTGDGASEAWTAGSTTNGTDVQGTIGGFAATGAGQTLVGASGTGAAGLSLQYTGTDTGDMGNITLGLGAGAAIQRIMDTYTDPNTGLLTQRGTALTNQYNDLVDRVAQVDERLANERLALVAKFSAMEAAIASLKSASAGLLGTSSTSAAASTPSLGSSPTSSTTSTGS